jgi:(S)-ureidoglycine aminohydrolase
MRYISLIIFSLCCFRLAYAQSDIVSSVYPWKSNATILQGSGAVLSDQQLNGHTIRGGKRLVFNTGSGGPELFFIIKQGPVEVTLSGEKRLLDKGSVVFVLPGDEVVLRNPRRDEVEIYEMRMHATNRDDARGLTAGPSFMMDWYDMSFKAHDKGGVRQLFDRKTVTMQRFDIHITQLNPGLSSHPPHTHKNEEIILMIDGEGEMTLGDTKHGILTGGTAWVASMLPHNITNTGKRPALYFAIQWN